MFTMFVFALGAHHAIEKAYVSREQRERENTHVQWRHFIAVFPSVGDRTQFISAGCELWTFLNVTASYDPTKICIQMRAAKMIASEYAEDVQTYSCGSKMSESPFIAYLQSHEKSLDKSCSRINSKFQFEYFLFWIECYCVHSAHNIYVQRTFLTQCTVIRSLFIVHLSASSNQTEKCCRSGRKYLVCQTCEPHLHE